jgi:hypothetical protein
MLRAILCIQRVFQGGLGVSALLLIHLVNIAHVFPERAILTGMVAILQLQYEFKLRISASVDEQDLFSYLRAAGDSNVLFLSMPAFNF